MDDHAYRTMSTVEDVNWFYQARLRAVQTLIRRYVIAADRPLRIIDVGCGTGGTSVAMAAFGHVTGVEPSTLAIDLLRVKFPHLEVQKGIVEDLKSIPGCKNADLVTALGVLCHREVKNPSEGIRSIYEALAPGGCFLWGDCVYPVLWRRHDDLVHCGRRFYPSEMHKMLRNNGFEIVYTSHFLGWGFPIALMMASLYRIQNLFFSKQKVTGVSRDSGDDRPLRPWINRMLKSLTYWEWHLGLLHLKVPFGVSRLILARKKALH